MFFFTLHSHFNPIVDSQHTSPHHGLKVLRYIQFVRAGQRLPAPNHITQRKPLASQAILLQANDWAFLYDLEGQLQFPIEAAVTSLRPDVVLFSHSSKTTVLLELTVPQEENVHQAHDRKTTKYSALVTACEENGFKTHMFALEVGCLGYCPHSFLHCFEALGLPKLAARQIRSEASKTALRSLYVLFLHRGMLTCSVKLFFTELYARRDRFVFFFCLHLLCHFRFAPFAPRDNSFRFQTYTQQPLAFRILQLSDVGRTITVLNCVLQFFARFPQD